MCQISLPNMASQVLIHNALHVPLQHLQAQADAAARLLGGCNLALPLALERSLCCWALLCCLACISCMGLLQQLQLQAVSNGIIMILPQKNNLQPRGQQLQEPASSICSCLSLQGRSLLRSQAWAV